MIFTNISVFLSKQNILKKSEYLDKLQIVKIVKISNSSVIMAAEK